MMRRGAQRLRRFASSRKILWVAVLLGVLLSLPSVASGFATEDFLFRAAAQKPFDLKDVNLFDAEEVSGGVRISQHVGSLPWITHDDFRISFWRPLTSLTHQLDYRVFTHNPAAAHVHSVLWYALAIFGVGLVLRRWVRPTWAAGLASVWWAMDEGHGHAVGWLSNRHVVVGTALVTLCLLLHDKGRRSKRVGPQLLSAAALGLSLLASESALGIWGFLLAYAWCLDAKRGAFRALLPHAAVSAAWLSAFVYLGHGARASGLYLDPRASPIAFLAELPERTGVLLLSATGLPSADTWHGASPTQVALLAVGGAIALLLLAVLTWPKRRAVALSIALVIALLPAAATFPSDRLLLLPSVAALALAASVVAEARAHPTALGRIVAGLSITTHNLVAPVHFPERSLAMAQLHANVSRASASAYALVQSERKRLIVLNAPDFYFCKLLREVRWTQPAPAAPILCLSGSLDAMEVTRVDPNALRLSLPGGFLDRPFNRLYRDERHPTRVGDKWFTGVAGVEIEQTDARGAPRQVLFRFLSPLESDKFVFVQWRGGQYVPFTPPAPGASITVRPLSDP